MILSTPSKQRARVHSKESLFLFVVSLVLLFSPFALWAQKQSVDTIDSQHGLFLISRLPFNSAYADYGMVPRNDQLIFTSARVNSLIRYTSEDKQPLTDIYCTQLKNGKWKTPVPFSMEINSRYNEGPISFDSAGNTVYFNRSDDNGKLKIFRSEFRNGQWQNIQELSINSNEYSLAHPSVSADGRTLFFSSDMPGGMGGKDLYVSFLEDGKWTVPENLGTPVNTSGNELFPFIHPHLNVLYFSSDGHEGFGMLDIIKAEKSGGLWAAVENAGEPFNSAGDDFAFFSDSTGKSGFFSSNRLKDDDDVFQFSLAEPLFLNPDTLKLNSYCVTLFEETTFFTDTLPYVYEWNLGNGQIKQGKEVQHCFPGPGEYAVYLNILDTLTGLRHAQEAEYRLELKDYEQLYISSADTIPAGTLVDFDASASNLPGCMIKSYFWDFGDGYRSKGNQVSHAFTKPGIYYVRLGSELIDASGKTSEKSVIKKITILNSSRNLSYEK